MCACACVWGREGFFGGVPLFFVNCSCWSFWRRTVWFPFLYVFPHKEVKIISGWMLMVIMVIFFYYMFLLDLLIKRERARARAGPKSCIPWSSSSSRLGCFPATTNRMTLQFHTRRRCRISLFHSLILDSPKRSLKRH